MNRGTKLCVSLMTAFLAALPVAATQIGPDECRDLTVTGCLEKLMAAESRLADSAKVEEVERQERRELADALTSSDIAGAASSLTDYLSAFLGAIGFDGLSDDEGSLTLRFPGFIQVDHAFDVSSQLVIREPEAFASLVEAIPEGVREERRGELESELEDFDDLSAGITLTVTRGRFGRSYGAFTRLFDAAVHAASREEAMVQLLSLVQDLPGSFAFDTELLGRLSPADQERIFGALQDLVAEQVGNEERLDEILERAQLLSFGRLVDNQPQLTFSFDRRSRATSAGPDAWSAKATYEQGFVNLNGLERTCGGVDEGGIDLDCAEQFMQRYERSAKWKHRFELGLEYGETDSFEFTLPDDGVEFSLDRVRRRIGSVAWGMPLRLDDDENAVMRFDLEAKYEDVSGDDERNDRFVATATFTRKLTGDASVALGLVYASRPEYLGEVDEELSAQLGLQFGLDREKKPE